MAETSEALCVAATARTALNSQAGNAIICPRRRPDISVSARRADYILKARNIESFQRFNFSSLQSFNFETFKGQGSNQPSPAFEYLACSCALKDGNAYISRLYGGSHFNEQTSSIICLSSGAASIQAITQSQLVLRCFASLIIE